MFTKKKFFITVFAILLSVCTLFLCSSCTLFAKELKNELPDENVVSIEKVTYNIENGEESSVSLPTDRVDTFMGILDVLEYVRDYNIRGVKYIPFDEVEYVIIYETYKIVLGEHYFTIYKDGEWQDAIRIKSISPIGKYNALSALFEE